MPRSPHNTRARSKVTRSADNRRQRRSLSTPTVPTPPPSTMASSGIALPDMEHIITQCLSNDFFIEKIIAQIAARVKEGVVQALTESFREARAEISELKGQITSLKIEMKQLEQRAEHRSDNLEQYTRRNNLRVFGVPEVAGENTDMTVTKLFREKLNLDIPLEKLERTHRVGKKINPTVEGGRRWRPIIVRFANYRDRRSVFQAKKKLKGTGTTVREDLTALRAEVLRAATAKYGVTNVWTADGRILWMHDGVKGMATTLEDLN